MKFKSNTGFTLVELLVAIAIVGILSAIVLLNIADQRSKVRDAERMHDLEQIAAALALYYADNGHYPIFNYNIGGVNSRQAAMWDTFDTYLKDIILPVDPINEPSDSIGSGLCELEPSACGKDIPPRGYYTYWYMTPLNDTNPQSYDLMALLENEHENACPYTEYTSRIDPLVSYCSVSSVLHGCAVAPPNYCPSPLVMDQ